MKLWRDIKKRYGIPNKPLALPSSFLSNPGDKYTWEDWEKESKDKYPFRYLLFESIPKYIGYQYYKADKLLYDFKSFHIAKEHLLDLRNTPVDSGITPYRKGWLSPHEVIEAAIIASFFRYVQLLNDRYDGIKSCQDNAKNWLYSAYNKKEKSSAAEQVEFYNRIAELVEFFNIKLPEKLKKRNGTRYDPENPDAMKILDEELRLEINEHLIEIVRLRHRMEP